MPIGRPYEPEGAILIYGRDHLQASAPTSTVVGELARVLKPFFDTGDYPVMDPTVGRPYPAFVHRNSDTTGAMRAIESIT